MIVFIGLLLLICLAHVWAAKKDGRRMGESAAFAVAIALLFLFAIPAFSQGTYFGEKATQASRSVAPGQSAPVYTVPFARVYICASTQAVCNAGNTVTVYVDAAMTTPLAQPVIADTLGHYGGFIAAGTYNRSIYTASGALVVTEPFSVLGPATGNISPTSVTTTTLATQTGSAKIQTAATLNSTQFADQFPGAELGAKVLAAFASMAGTAENATQNAIVKLSPGATYTATTTIELPRSNAAPYIMWPVLDCQGATINSTVTGATPVITVHGRAENESTSHTSLVNCIINRADPNGPVVQSNNAKGFYMANTMLNGGATSYLVYLSTNDGGTGDVENTLLSNVSMANYGVDGYLVEQGVGGTGGYEYNFCKMCRFEPNADSTHLTHSAVHVAGTGIGLWSGEYDIHVNVGNPTGTVATLYLLQVDAGSTALTNHFRFDGEDDGTQTVFTVGGGGQIDMDCTELTRVGVVYQPGTSLSNSASCHSAPFVTDFSGAKGFVIQNSEGNSLQPPPRRGDFFSDGDKTVISLASAGGFEFDNVFNLQVCMTNSTYQRVSQSPSCVPLIYTNPIYNTPYVGMGITNPAYMLDVGLTGINATSYHVGGAAGVTCSGAPTSSYAVTNGIVTHC